MDEQNQFAATQAPADEGFSFGKRINGQPVVPGMGAASDYTPPAPPAAAPTHSFNPAPQPAAEEPPTFAQEPAPAPEPAAEPSFSPVAEAAPEPAPEPEPTYKPEPEQPMQDSGYVPPSFSQAFQNPAASAEPAPEPQAEPIPAAPAETAPEAEAEAPAVPAFSEAFSAPAEPAAEAEAPSITAEQAWENIPDNAKEAAGLDPATEFEQLPEAVREGLEEGISNPEVASAPYEQEVTDQPQPALAEEATPVADERTQAIQNALEVLNSPAAEELSTRTRVQVEELKVLLEKGLSGSPEDVDRLKADGLDVIEKVADGIGSKNGLSTPFVNATSQLFRTEAVSPIDEHRRSQTIFAAREATANQIAAESGAFDLQQKQAQASHQQKLAEQREGQPVPGQYL